MGAAGRTSRGATRYDEDSCRLEGPPPVAVGSRAVHRRPLRISTPLIPNGTCNFLCAQRYMKHRQTPSPWHSRSPWAPWPPVAQRRPRWPRPRTLARAVANYGALFDDPNEGPAS
jgi:hypothetical protein